MKSNRWIKRQVKDQYIKKAKKEGFLSRAAYKLIEIENRYNLIKKSNKILDLGSSPGSWSQVILHFNENIQIDAFDISDMKFKHNNLYFQKKDFFNLDLKTWKKKYDLILSDIAPNTIGHKSTDHLRIVSLILDIISRLDFIANNNSSFVTKIWKGSDESLILHNLKNKYKTVTYFKPKSSRKDSSEIFIVCENFIN